MTDRRGAILCRACRVTDGYHKVMRGTFEEANMNSTVSGTELIRRATRRGGMTLVSGLVLASCDIALPGSDAKPSGSSATAAPGSAPQALAGANKTATIELEKGGIITIGLFGGNDPKTDAPSTVKNFEAKANQGFYNGLKFHRVEDWVVQGGDPKGDGTGGGQINSEYNEREFRVGAVGIARGPDPRVNNDSQFFIVKRDSPHLNKSYTNFGQVTGGLELIVKIAIGDKIKKISVK